MTTNIDLNLYTRRNILIQYFFRSIELEFDNFSGVAISIANEDYFIDEGDIIH